MSDRETYKYSSCLTKKWLTFVTIISDVQLIDVLNKLQSQTYVKLRGMDREPVHVGETYAVQLQRELDAGLISRKDYITKLGYRFPGPTLATCCTVVLVYFILVLNFSPQTLQILSARISEINPH